MRSKNLESKPSADTYQSQAYQQMSQQLKSLQPLWYKVRQKPQSEPLWVWNGRTVTVSEFAKLAYGDTPQRTLFLLKYGDQ